MLRNALVVLGLLSAATIVCGQGIGLDMSAGMRSEALRQPEAAPPVAPGPEGVTEPVTGEATGEVAGEKSSGPTFGHTGAQFWSVGAGYMNNFKDDQAGDLSFGWSRFIADELEFNLELSGWYFNQTGQDTGGVSAIMALRWHFLHDESYDWSLFAEAGFGLLFAFDNVPAGGTGFNFLPRLGGGFTKLLDDDGTRFIAGLRWQHISNGRIEGDDRNPGRDSLMVFAGVMFPF